MPYYQFSVNGDGGLDVKQVQNFNKDDCVPLLTFLKSYVEGSDEHKIIVKRDNNTIKFICGEMDIKSLSTEIGAKYLNGHLNEPIMAANLSTLTLTVEQLKQLKTNIDKLQFFSKNTQNGGQKGGEDPEENLLKVFGAFYELAFSVLYQPVIIKLISLDTTMMNEFFKNHVSKTPKIEFMNSSDSVINQSSLDVFKINLLNFLFVDITDILNNNEMKRVLNDLLKPEPEQEKEWKNNKDNYFAISGQQTTANIKLCKISDWVKFLKIRYGKINVYNAFKDTNARQSTILTNFLIKTMSQNYENIMKIHEFLSILYKKQTSGNFINANKLKELSEMIEEKNSERIITYLKIRINNTTDIDPYVLNRRFKIYLNDSELGTNYLVGKRSQMVMKYYDNNAELYDNDENETNVNISAETPKTYNFGNFSKVFLPNETNNDIAKDMTQIIKQVEAGKPVFIIGYGASGAGKTSSLIYFKGAPNRNGQMVGKEEGILIHLCNIFGEKGYTNLEVKTKELFNTDNYNKTDRFDYTVIENNAINFGYDRSKKSYNLTNEYKHTNKHYYRNVAKDNKNNRKSEEIFTATTSLGVVLIHLVDQDRFVKATTNNINSSRSHVLVFLKFTNEENKTLNLIVGDFAGVENEFDCNEKYDKQTIQKFSKIKRDDASGDYYYSTEAIAGYDDPVGDNGKTSVSNSKNNNASTAAVSINFNDNELNKYDVYEEGDDDFGTETTINVAKHVSNIEGNQQTDLRSNLLNTKVPIYDFENPVFVRDATNQDRELGAFTRSNKSADTIIKKQRTFINLKNYFEQYCNNNNCSPEVILKKCIDSFENFRIGIYLRLYKFLTKQYEINNGISLIYTTLTTFFTTTTTVNGTFSDYLLYYFGKNIHFNVEEYSAKLVAEEKELNSKIQQKSIEISEETTRIDTAKTNNEKKYNETIKKINVEYKNKLDELNKILKNLSYLKPENDPKLNGNSYFTGNMSGSTYTNKGSFMSNNTFKKFKKYILDALEYVGNNAYDSIIENLSDKSYNKIEAYHDIAIREIENAIENAIKTTNSEKGSAIQSLKKTETKTTLPNLNTELTNLNTSLNNIRNQTNIVKIALEKLQQYLKGETLATGDTEKFEKYKYNTKENKTMTGQDIINKVNDLIQRITGPLRRVLSIIDENKSNINLNTIAEINNALKIEPHKICLLSLLIEAMRPIMNMLNQERLFRQENYMKICKSRVTEGKFINKSLQDLRDSMKLMLLSKSKDVTYLTPDFINECLSCYCPSKNDCFNINDNNISSELEKIDNEPRDKSVIIDSIISGLGKPRKEIYDTLLISIFCVFNGNRSANNPPPVPYVDINNLKRFWYQKYAGKNRKMFANVIDGENEFIKYSKEIIEKICDYANMSISETGELTIKQSQNTITKLIDIIENPIFVKFKELFYGAGKTIDVILKNKEFTIIVPSFLTMIDNSNAVSAIGTLEFVDLMGKFNSVNSICNVETNMEENTNYFRELGDIIRTTHGGKKTRKLDKDNFTKKTRKHGA